MVTKNMTVLPVNREIPNAEKSLSLVKKEKKSLKKRKKAEIFVLNTNESITLPQCAPAQIQNGILSMSAAAGVNA